MTSPVTPRFPTAVMAAEMLLAMQLHPLAADTHERLLQSSQLTQLGQPECVVAQNSFPADVTQTRRDRWHRGRSLPLELVRALSRSPSRSSTSATTGGRSTPNPASSKSGRAVAEKRQDARSVRRVFAGSRRGQSTSERGHESGSLTETAEEVLVGVRDMAPDRGQLRAVGPDILGGDHQAGVVDRLEGEFDAPALLRTSRTVLLPSPGSRGRARRVESAALRRPPRVGRSESRSVLLRPPAPRRVPHGKPSGQLDTLVLVAPIHGTVGGCESTHPGIDDVRLRHLAVWPVSLPGCQVPGQSVRHRPTSANAGPRRWVRSLPATHFPCSIQVRGLAAERGRKGPRERFDPTPVMPVDERAPARPPALSRRTRDRAAAGPGQGARPPFDRVGGEADIGPEHDAGGIRVRERRIAASQRRQRAEESRGSGRVEHVARCRPRREVLLGTSRARGVRRVPRSEARRRAGSR